MVRAACQSHGQSSRCLINRQAVRHRHTATSSLLQQQTRYAKRRLPHSNRDSNLRPSEAAETAAGSFTLNTSCFSAPGGDCSLPTSSSSSSLQHSRTRSVKPKACARQHMCTCVFMCVCACVCVLRGKASQCYQHTCERSWVQNRRDPCKCSWREQHTLVPLTVQTAAPTLAV